MGAGGGRDAQVLIRLNNYLIVISAPSMCVYFFSYTIAIFVLYIYTFTAVKIIKGDWHDTRLIKPIYIFFLRRLLLTRCTCGCASIVL